jgi:hypothetical protein
LAKGDNGAIWNDYKMHARIATKVAGYDVVRDVCEAAWLILRPAGGRDVLL